MALPDEPAAFGVELVRNIYRIFLGLSQAERQTLLAEAAALRDAERQSLTETVTRQLDSSRPASLSPQAVSRALGECVAALATDPRGDPAGLAHSLRTRISGCSEQPLEELQPPDESQQRLASLLTQSLLSRPPKAARHAAGGPVVLEIDGYTRIRWLGSGGFGSVWLARDPTGQPCALKIGRLDPGQEERFQREVQVLRLGHPRLVGYRASGIVKATDEGLWSWIAQEYVPGRDLQALLVGGRIELQTALLIGQQILEGLTALHEHGVVHRDLKPANILVSLRDFGVKLTDFGLSRLAAPGGRHEVTRTGTLVGTPLYMSPEQVRGEHPGPQSDVWSFGVVLYEMLAGKPLFEAANAMELGAMILNATIRPAGLGVAEELQSFLAHEVARRRYRRAVADRWRWYQLPSRGCCLARDPKSRFADACVALTALEAVARVRCIRDNGLLERWARGLQDTWWDPGRVAECQAAHASEGPLDEEALVALLPEILEKERAARAEEARRKRAELERQAREWALAREADLEPERAIDSAIRRRRELWRRIRQGIGQGFLWTLGVLSLMAGVICLAKGYSGRGNGVWVFLGFLAWAVTYLCAEVSKPAGPRYR